MKQYILILIWNRLEGGAYQEIINGEVVRILDLDGNEITFPAGVESEVIDTEPVRPRWAPQE